MATKHELEKQLAEQAELIRELEEQKEELEYEAGERDCDNDEFRKDAGLHFTALCAALDELLSFRGLPIALQLSFERLAEHLGAGLPLRR